MIIKMKRITLVAHRADEAEILKALQKTQSLEIIDAGHEEGADEKALAGAQERVDRLGEALKTLRPFAGKKGLLSAAPEVTLAEVVGKVPEALGVSEELDRITRELARTRSELEKNAATMETLRPWEAFPADMQTFQNARSVKYLTGMIGGLDVEKLENIDACAEYQLFCDGPVRSCVVACPASEAKSVANFLKSLDWTDFAFPKLSGSPKQAIRQLENENAALGAQMETLEKQLAEKAGGVSGEVEEAYDAAVIERDRTAAALELSRSAATFCVEGWVPEDRLDRVEKAVRSVTDAYCFSSRDPEEGEIPPSVVENSKFATPFEQVTNLYSPPDPYGLDPTPYMAPFYVLLFGLMLSDTGYGILLAIGSYLFNKIKKPTGMMGGIVKVLFWGGLSTIVWGFLTGSFFGLDFDVVFGTNNVFPLLVDPMEDPIKMLFICFGLGLIHIFTGMILKMKMCFSRGDWQTAIFDNFSWILIILGLLGLILPATKTVGMIMAIAGAAMILLFKGRGKKNPLMRTAAGLGELYQVSGYLSDVLSYARLFALGIATGVIASVFNQLCGMLMGSPVLILRILGFIVAVALLIALHLFNIGINTLGAFVHCARLQYVEFYGKFYESGGRPFKPLGYRTKHVRITDET